MPSRWKRILLGVAIGSAALVGLGLILIHTIGEHETRYQGQPLSYWFKEFHSADATISNQAVAALQATVIPQLTERMFQDTSDSHLRLALVDWFNTLPGVTIYFTPAEGRRVDAVSSIGQFGPPAQKAIPDLIKALKGTDSAVRGPAARALGQIHCEPDRVIPLLRSYLDDPQDGVPEGAVEGLGGFGVLAKAALPKLMELSKVPDKDLRAAVSAALKRIDPEGKGPQESQTTTNR